MRYLWVPFLGFALSAIVYSIYVLCHEILRLLENNDKTKTKKATANTTQTPEPKNCMVISTPAVCSNPAPAGEYSQPTSLEKTQHKPAKSTKPSDVLIR